MKLDDLGLNEVLSLYQEKKDGLKQGDMMKLVELQKTYPELFSSEKEDEINLLVSQIEFIANTPHFKEMIRKDEMKKFIVLDSDSWKPGMIDDALSKIDVIRFSNMHKISRLMVNEAIAVGIAVSKAYDIEDVSIANIFPFMGFILKDLLQTFSELKRTKMIERMMFKFNVTETMDQRVNVGNKTYNDWYSTISNHEKFKKEINYRFGDLLDKVTRKFDQRDDFNSDCYFFLLLEVSQYLGLMADNIAKINGDTKKDILQRVINHIVINNDYVCYMKY